MQRKIDLEKYPLQQIALWRRINNLIKNCNNIMDLEQYILDGDEESIRQIVKIGKETRASLLKKAKEMKVKYYGRLTKEELVNAISSFEKNKTARQKYER